MAYASSKSALRSLTSSLAVELGDRASFCLIEPAAINTEMLRSGFQDNEGFLESLMAIHPCGSIGEASDIAEMVFFLASMKTNFINGSIFSIDGGIRGVLSDLND
jgi:NAD(P)-dependent dehydrogenase (short-subunit alcohol dehydrogenase family)